MIISSCLVLVILFFIFLKPHPKEKLSHFDQDCAIFKNFSVSGRSFCVHVCPKIKEENRRIIRATKPKSLSQKINRLFPLYDSKQLPMRDTPRMSITHILKLL
jgi:hypothetical protein